MPRALHCSVAPAPAPARYTRCATAPGQGVSAAPVAAPAASSLHAASTALLLAGLASAALALHLTLRSGTRRYFLDCSLAQAAAALLVGARGCCWHGLASAHRTFVTGYIVLSIFSSLNAVSLGVMLVLDLPAGTPFADMVGGVVCGFAVLALSFAFIGAIISHCCQVTPPDNRVQHAVTGFSV
ncbi:uncharacterized protein LOC126184389 [Schistocerca cancellata]|uniref:uncharacterized protein LOC126184389 n=1 Tax=Schistocerca cancellata TaxID=274614 RepID=UPI0021176661|nr:uncharacterized protein LOC126184389 [Schistocerca cancellata]